MAMLLGALIIYGMQPGPMLIKQHPDLFWGAVTSMYIGNVMLLVLNLPLIGLWVKILKIPYPVLFPLILLFCLIGVYSLNNNVAEIGLMLVFGGLGYLMKKFDYEAAPLVLALVLGPMMEHALRQSLIMSNGSPRHLLHPSHFPGHLPGCPDPFGSAPAALGEKEKGSGGGNGGRMIDPGRP
jgi:putative tricarboxylic transport membrane protein